jgi:hypothetical protein
MDRRAASPSTESPCSSSGPRHASDVHVVRTRSYLSELALRIRIGTTRTRGVTQHADTHAADMLREFPSVGTLFMATVTFGPAALMGARSTFRSVRDSTATGYSVGVDRSVAEQAERWLA